MIRTMARVTDVHILEEDNEVMDLPKVNEELKNFFLPRKYVAPEPEPVPEAKAAPHVEGTDSVLEAVKAAPADVTAVPEPVKALRAASGQPPQSPTSAYRPGAFDNRGLADTAASPAKPSKKWFSFTKSKSKSRLNKESNSSRFSSFNNPTAAAAAALPVPTRFLEKHGADAAGANKAEEPAAEEPVAETAAEPVAELTPAEEEHKGEAAVEAPVEAEKPAVEAAEPEVEIVEAPVVVEEKKADVPAESEVTAEEPIVSEPIAAEPVPEFEAETPKEIADEPANDIEAVEEPKEAPVKALLAEEPILEAPEEKEAEEVVAEQPVTIHGEASTEPEEIIVSDALVGDMHSIAEHPTAEAEVAAEMPVEGKEAVEEPAEAAAVAEVAVPEQTEELKEATEESASEVTDISQEGADHEVVHKKISAEEEGGEKTKVVEGAQGHLLSAPEPADVPAPAKHAAPAKPAAPSKNASCGCCNVQ